MEVAEKIFYLLANLFKVPFFCIYFNIADFFG